MCKAGNLTGSQGVIIPESNVMNLMLKDEIIDSVKQKQFHVFTVNNIDEGIEILTGIQVGKINDDGTFEKDSINYRADQKIKMFSEKFREKPEHNRVCQENIY